MSDTRELRVTYVRNPNFVAAAASSMTVTGPTGDGMIHFHFVRDIQAPVSENFIATKVSDASGAAVGESLTPNGAGEVANHKELVATMSVPVGLLGNMGAALTQLAQHLNIQGEAAPILNFQDTLDGGR